MVFDGNHVGLPRAHGLGGDHIERSIIRGEEHVLNKRGGNESGLHAIHRPKHVNEMVLCGGCNPPVVGTENYLVYRMRVDHMRHLPAAGGIKDSSHASR